MKKLKIIILTLVLSIIVCANGLAKHRYDDLTYNT